METPYQIQLNKRMQLEAQDKVMSFVGVLFVWFIIITMIVNWEIILYYFFWIRGVKEATILTIIILHERRGWWKKLN